MTKDAGSPAPRQDDSPPSAVIISTGDELVAGLTVNTNAAWLSRRLAEVGIRVQSHITIGDDQAALTRAITDAIGRCQLLLITGGLGPTEDDLTRPALAEALGEPLVEDAAARAWLEAFFQRLNRPMTANNRRQAQRPASARCVENTCGTAPGLVVRRETTSPSLPIKSSEAQGSGAKVTNPTERPPATDIFVMPGVPREMEAMFERSFLPRLKSRGCGRIRRVWQINTFGAGESWIGRQIQPLMRRGANPSVGTTVHEGVVSVRIYAIGTVEEVEAGLRRTRQAVLEKLGDLVFAENDFTLEQAVAALLKERGHTVATAESCTGGLLAQLLTNIPGSSAYFLRGWVTYSNAAKEEDLQVDPATIARHGAVSEPVAQAMADGARRRASADFGVGITGIAGPDGGATEKPVGLVYIGLAGPSGVAVRRCQFAGDRHGIRLRAAQMALTLLRLNLLGRDPNAVLP